LIIYTPLRKIFETVPLGLMDWVIALIGGLLIVIIFNIFKRINNKKQILKLENF
jgi:hypothetical protein